ncbi:hypothetical protein B0T19DRAFT_128029 [Cercophora scortea]|uniref:Secreted protein n=1 Tax=Cercophora scortea TaxID=314031 RepID=A0AAE0MJ27_9PEZI|nr:hypothetical protein B0T19DRAFT_128029 [Cercophora scortea]
MTSFVSFFLFFFLACWLGLAFSLGSWRNTSSATSPPPHFLYLSLISSSLFTFTRNRSFCGSSHCHIALIQAGRRGRLLVRMQVRLMGGGVLEKAKKRNSERDKTAMAFFFFLFFFCIVQRRQFWIMRRDVIFSSVCFERLMRA